MLKRFVLSFAAVMNLLLLDQVVKELAVITYSTRAPIFLDLLKEDLISTD